MRSAPRSPAPPGGDGPQPPCDRCPALCCRYLATEIDPPRSPRDVDDIRWYLLHQGVSVFLDAEGAWFLAFDSPCRELDAEGRCRRYAERPQLCRSHGRRRRSCEYFGPLCAARFTTVAEFESWLADRGSAWRDRGRRERRGAVGLQGIRRAQPRRRRTQ